MSPKVESVLGAKLSTLGRFFVEERRDLWMVVIYAMLIGLLSLAAPVGTQAVVNTIAFGTLLQPIVILTSLVFVGLLLSGILRAIQTYVIEILQQRLFVRNAVQIAQKFSVSSFDAFRHTYGPEKANQFFDIVTLQKTLSSLLLEGVSIALQTGIGMLVLATYHPILLVFDLALICFLVIIIYFLGKGALETSLLESSAKYRVGAWIQELARHPTVFRSAQGIRFASLKIQSLLLEYLQHRKSHFKIVFRQILGSLWLQAVTSAMLLGIGGSLVIKRQLTLGQLVAAELILSTVVSGIAKFGKHLEDYYDLRASLEKVYELIDIKEQPDQGESIVRESVGLKVLFKHLGFSASLGPSSGVTLEIPAGGRVAILGKTQAELSTLAELLFGIASPAFGSVILDGIPIQEWNLVSLRSHVSWLKGNEIFAGTVAENVHLGNPEVSTDEIRQAIIKANLSQSIESLKEGMFTTLLPHGAPLSFLDSRKLMIARMLVHRPKLLVIQGAFLSPFEAGSSAWQHVLFDPAHGWTLLLLTTDPQLCRFCDQVYELEQGQIKPLTEEGGLL